VRRAEERMKNDLGFARQLRRVLKILDHSSIDSAEKPVNLICHRRKQTLRIAK
jgi:hypothetical protein